MGVERRPASRNGSPAESERVTFQYDEKLEELRARMPELRRREATLRAELDALDTEIHDAETYLKLTETLEAFRARLSTNAEKLTLEQRQEIVRLVVSEVLLGDEDVTVGHSIPVPAGNQPSGSLLRSQSLAVVDHEQDRLVGIPVRGRQGRRAASRPASRSPSSLPSARAGSSHPPC
jgi:predicted nuclease with TOPRIM domain